MSEPTVRVQGAGMPNRWMDLVSAAPWELPRYSERIARARQYVFTAVDDIRDSDLRGQVRAMLEAANLPERIVLAQRAAPFGEDQRTARKMHQQLPYDPTWAAPGAVLRSHHSYPGGWALHTALNLRATRSLIDDAVSLKRATVDTDALLAAMVLHDWAKLRLLVWNEKHELDGDEGPGHHELALAECMARGFSPHVVQIMAGVHGGWWVDPEGVRASLQRAADLAKSAVDTRPYLAERGMETSLEAWIAHQAERCWYASSRQAAGLVNEKLRAAFTGDDGDRETFMRLRNVIYMIFDEFQLLRMFADEGLEKVKARLERVLDSPLPQKSGA